MKITLKQLQANLRKLGLMGTDAGKRLSYARFKNRASIHRYGAVKRIVFIGNPKDNLFAFYTSVPATDTETMVEAYAMYVRLVKGDESDLNKGLTQWGIGIPKEYSDMKQK